VNLTVDIRSPVPAFEQLAQRLREGIAAELQPDDPIPSLRAIVAVTGLSDGTVQKAVRRLKDEGLVYSVRGRGVFVR
jgi:DNA-binding transcriptional regulator YhcF (GntR family)